MTERSQSLARRLTVVTLAAAAALVCAPIAGASAGELPPPAPGAQDVNGDGLDDLLYWGDPGAPSSVVTPPFPERVVFGTRGGGFIDVRRLGTGGYVDSGAYSSDGRPAGDVNGDGHADFLAGAGRPGRGWRSYGTRVAFGQAASGTVTSAGFTIHDSHPASAAANEIVVGVGDVNHDGFDDLAAYRPQLPPQVHSRHDTLQVIFGGTSTRDVDLAHLGRRGITIRVPRQRAASDYNGISLAGVGDLDGDGIGDLAAAADWYPASSCGTARNGEPSCDGRVWVIYGRRHLPSTIDVTRLGRHGMTVAAGTGRPRPGGRFSELLSPSAAGDLDGDGFDDMLVHVDEMPRHRAVVVWGGRRARSPRRVVLSARSARFPDAVLAVVDFDGDHRADLLGLPDATRYDSGCSRVFVIRGRHFSGLRRDDPSSPADGHLLVRHANSYVIAAGDVNGDGRADIAVAPGLGPDAPTAGAVIFGSPAREPVDPDDPGARGLRYGVP